LRPSNNFLHANTQLKASQSSDRYGDVRLFASIAEGGTVSILGPMGCQRDHPGVRLSCNLSHLRRSWTNRLLRGYYPQTPIGRDELKLATFAVTSSEILAALPRHHSRIAEWKYCNPSTVLASSWV
jgi:hypothetical protein